MIKYQEELDRELYQNKEKWEKEKSEYQRLCQWYVNCIRYQLGNVIIACIKHPHKLILLPYYVYKLFQKHQKDSRKFSDIESRMKIITSNPKEYLTINEKTSKNHTRILFVMMGTNGGSVKTNEDLMQYLSENGYEVYLLSSTRSIMKLFKCEKDELSLIREYEMQQPWEITRFHDRSYEDIYSDTLHNLQIDIVHIRHFYYHTFDIVKVAKHLNLPILISFHDFYCICPTINMINEKDVYCQGECYRKRKKCKISVSNVKIPGNMHDWVDQTWRTKIKEILRDSSGCITTSYYTVGLFKKFYNDSLSHLYVIEHGRDFSYDRNYIGTYPCKDQKIKILLAGNIGFFKGEEYIIKLIEIDKAKRIEWHCIGTISEKLITKVQYYGKFIRDDFNSYVQKIRPSYVGIFSVWPETYCHVLTEAWSCGLPCIVSDIGTLRERAENGGAILADLSSPKDAYQKILSYSYDENLYEKLCQEVQLKKIRSIADMGDDYIEVYRNSLINQKRCKLI
jgi:glycosyltransferase involved in cell wall biosynthesis